MKRDPVLLELRLNKRLVRRCTLVLSLSVMLLLGPSGISQEPAVPLFPTTSFAPFFAAAVPLVESPHSPLQLPSLSAKVDFVTVDDFDEDGTADLLVSANDVLQFKRGDGKGNFAFGPINFYQKIVPDTDGNTVIGSNTDAFFVALAQDVADFNNDNHLDIAVVVDFFDTQNERVRRSLHAFLGRGNGLFKATEPLLLSDRTLDTEADSTPCCAPRPRDFDLSVRQERLFSQQFR